MLSFEIAGSHDRTGPRILLAVVVATVLAGCVSYGVSDIAAIYYRRGPETALDFLEYIEVPPSDRSLAQRDRSVALIELGYYEEAIKSLLSVIEGGLLAEGTWPESIRSESGAFLGETHERIMVPTLAMASALALQDIDEAAAWADRSLAMARALECGPGGAPGTWVLAALAYEAVGRIGAAQNAYYEASFGSGAPDSGAEVVQHLTAVDPVQRSLVVVVMLGTGPFKSAGRVTLPSGTAVAWPSYEREGRPVKVTATARIDGGEEVPSVEVEDLWATAKAGLGRRYDEILSSMTAAEAEEGDAAPVGAALGGDETTAGPDQSAFQGSSDLQSWWSLPATIHLIRVPVPETAEKTTLRVVDERGTRLWGEVFPIPEEWRAGPLFVIRRVP